MNLNNVTFKMANYVSGSGEITLIDKDVLEHNAGIVAVEAKLDNVWTFVKEVGRDTTGTVKPDDRTAYYSANPGGADLIALFDYKIAFCRERAILLHILLAQMGFSSAVVSAKRDKDASRHAFVLAMTSKGEVIFDPENRNYDNTAGNFPNGYEIQTVTDTYIFNDDIAFNQIAAPSNLAAPVTLHFAGKSFTVTK